MSFELKDTQEKFFSTLLKQLNDIRFIKLFSLIENYQIKLENKYINFFNKIRKLQIHQYLLSMLDILVTLFANSVLFFLGGTYVFENKITLGDFTIIMVYFSYITNSFKYFSNLGRLYQNNLVSYNRIKYIFNKKIYENGSLDIKSINNLTCSDVCFNRKNKCIIKNFNYIFQKSKAYVIRGKNGIGKTTLLELMIGLFQGEYSGEIYYDDYNSKSINMYKLRKQNIAILEQKTDLVYEDLINNIILDKNYNISNLNKFIGLNKILQDLLSNSNNLNINKNEISGGECQKVGILRMFSKKADLYIMDEPTNALDHETLKIILENIEILKKDSIVIIVSHDNRVIDYCDEIITI